MVIQPGARDYVLAVSTYALHAIFDSVQVDIINNGGLSLTGTIVATGRL